MSLIEVIYLWFMICDLTTDTFNWLNTEIGRCQPASVRNMRQLLHVQKTWRNIIKTETDKPRLAASMVTYQNEAVDLVCMMDGLYHQLRKLYELASSLDESDHQPLK